MKHPDNVEPPSQSPVQLAAPPGLYASVHASGTVVVDDSGPLSGGSGPERQSALLGRKGLFQVNGTRYPTLRRMLDAQAEGIDSFPQCMVSVDLMKGIWAEYPKSGQEADLPPKVRQALSASAALGVFRPEFHHLCQLALLRDTYEASDELLMRGIRRRLTSMFSSFLWRAALMAWSPHDLILRSSKGWNRVHTGTTLRFIGRQRDGVVASELHAPVGLYDDLMLKGFAASFEAAMHMTHVGK
ncbi:MAG TPA: hypothetical protein VFH51_17340, partial [Myxococcota bacterium]|nr:hypothetical protein [Myxococcota bacterium]